MPAAVWQPRAAGGLDEDPFFLTVFLSTYGAAVAAWLLVLGGVAGYSRLSRPQLDFALFEQSMILRLRVFGRGSVLGLIGCHGWLAYLYFQAEEPLVAPFFGVARPLLCVLVAAFGWFADSHPLFRWVFALGQGAQIFADTYDLWVASSALVLNADEAGAFGGYCPGRAEYDAATGHHAVTAFYATPRRYDCAHLEQLQYRNYATIVLGIWTVLQCAYFMVSQGFFSTRYHVFKTH